jgi:hypothetical protein
MKVFQGLGLGRTPGPQAVLPLIFVVLFNLGENFFFANNVLAHKFIVASRNSSPKKALFKSGGFFLSFCH